MLSGSPYRGVNFISLRVVYDWFPSSSSSAWLFHVFAKPYCQFVLDSNRDAGRTRCRSIPSLTACPYSLQSPRSASFFRECKWLRRKFLDSSSNFHSQLSQTLSIYLWLSCRPSCKKIIRNGTTGELSCLPFVAALFRWVKMKPVTVSNVRCRFLFSSYYPILSHLQLFHVGALWNLKGRHTSDSRQHCWIAHPDCVHLRFLEICPVKGIRDLWCRLLAWLVT